MHKTAILFAQSVKNVQSVVGIFTRHRAWICPRNIHAHTVWVGLALDGSERLLWDMPCQLSRSADGLPSVPPISIPNGAPDWLRCAAPECLLGQMPDHSQTYSLWLC